MTIKALYVTGEVVTEDQISGSWLQSGAAVSKPAEAEETFATGTKTITLTETSIAPNLSYCLTVEPPKYASAAAKYVTATSAEGAGSSTAYTALSEGAPQVIAAVTDGSGTVRVSNTNVYIKWVDEDGLVLGLQSVRLVIRTLNDQPGAYDTQTTSMEVAVNRGVGTYEFFLTDGVDFRGEPLPDYVAYINGYLNSRTRSGEREYYLYLYASFQEQFYQGYDAEKEETIYTSYQDYENIRVEITPFEGKSFAEAPGVEAYYNDPDTGEEVPLSFTSKLAGGKAVLTGVKPKGDDITVYLTVTGGDVTQNLSIEFWGRTSSSGTSAYVDTWAEALEELAKGTEYVSYRGAEDVTLTDALTIAPKQSLVFQKANFTIGRGGVLTLEGKGYDAAYVNLSGENAVLTVAAGGKITTNAQTEGRYSTYTRANAYRGKIVVEDGGSIVVPDNGLFELYSSRGEIVLEAGSIVTSGTGSNLEFYTNDGAITIGGTLDTAASLYIYGTTTVEDTAKINNTGYFRTNGRFVNYGDITNSGNTIQFNGRTENYGTIDFAGGRTVYFSHTGYTVVNEGTIKIASGVRLELRGTVLLNNGTITGAGTLAIGDVPTSSEYDNGIEYAEREGDQETPGDYDRYKFVRDPAETVNEVTFYGELDDHGVCDVTVED